MHRLEVAISSYEWDTFALILTRRQKNWFSIAQYRCEILGQKFRKDKNERNPLSK